jgi:hypothetical protein
MLLDLSSLYLRSSSKRSANDKVVFRNVPLTTIDSSYSL